MKVVFFQRRSYSHQFSIEKVFDGIRELLTHEDDLVVEYRILPHFSVGIFSRIKNVLWSGQHQGDVNHITGDVHYVALGMATRKTILTIHDLNFLNHPSLLARFILKTFWLTLPLKKVSYVTVVSEATKKDLLSRIKFPENKVKVIPNYYDPIFKTLPKEFNEASPRVLQIGTKENKNVSRLIEALDGINCHLVIVGGSNQRIKNHLESHHISFTWLQNLSEAELIEQYQQCDMLTLISTSEGFGIPILEAQAVGRPVVTSNISSMPEVAGNGACYVDPLDVNSIRSGILKIINNQTYRQSLIDNGFQNIRKFHKRNIAAMYRDLYLQLKNKN